jgi:hypothetical protein
MQIVPSQAKRQNDLLQGLDHGGRACRVTGPSVKVRQVRPDLGMNEPRAAGRWRRGRGKDRHHGHVGMQRGKPGQAIEGVEIALVPATDIDADRLPHGMRHRAFEDRQDRGGPGAAATAMIGPV